MTTQSALRLEFTRDTLALIKGYLVADLSQHPEACIIVMSTMDHRIAHFDRMIEIEKGEDWS